MSMYANILEDVTKSDGILEENHRVYHTDNAEIYSGFRNTSDVFNIKSKDPEKWLLPSESTLRVQFSLTNEAGDAPYLASEVDEVYENDMATLICGGLHLFSQARLLIDDNQVELVQRPGYVQLLEHLLTSNWGHIRSCAEGEWMHLDDGKFATGQFIETTIVSEQEVNRGPEADGSSARVKAEYGLANPTKFLTHGPGIENEMSGFNPRYNSGFAARLLRTDNRRIVELAIPAVRLFSFFADVRNAYKGIQFEIELTKCTNYTEIIHGRGAFATTGVDGAGPQPYPVALTARTLIRKIEWIVPTIVPNTLILEETQEKLKSGRSSKKVFHNSTTYIQEFTPPVLIAPDVGSETYDFDWRVQSTGKKVTQIAVALQRLPQYASQNDPDTWAAGDIRPLTSNHSNGGVFSTLTDINNLEVRFGSTVLPKERYQRLSFSDNSPDFVRVYADFLCAGGKWSGDDDDGGIVSYKTFQKLYPIFVFDTSNMDLTTGGTTTEDLRILATVKPVQLGVSNRTPERFRAVCVVTYESEVNFYGIDGRLAIELPS